PAAGGLAHRQGSADAGPWGAGPERWSGDAEGWSSGSGRVTTSHPAEQSEADLLTRRPAGVGTGPWGVGTERRSADAGRAADGPRVAPAVGAPEWRCVRCLGDVHVWATAPVPAETTGPAEPAGCSGPGDLFISLPLGAATDAVPPGPGTGPAPAPGDILLHDAPYPFLGAFGAPAPGGRTGTQRPRDITGTGDHEAKGASGGCADGTAVRSGRDLRPAHSVRATADATVSPAVAVAVPRAALLLPAKWIDGLLGRRIPVPDPVGGLLAGLVHGIASDAAGFGPAAAERLGTAVLDLSAALLARELDLDAPEESHRRSLLLRIQVFANRRLGDPRLGPGMIADAHGVSVGYLHRLLHEHDTTLAAWIRRRRLDGARRDLSDPRLAGIRLQEIGTRWGFPHPSAFSRAFRAAYGTTPKDYRETAARPAEPASPSG
ncbi:helix-turn-helix domain-containing protein, partial [Nocardiopsis sediminis]